MMNSVLGATHTYSPQRETKALMIYNFIMEYWLLKDQWRIHQNGCSQRQTLTSTRSSEHASDFFLKWHMTVPREVFSVFDVYGQPGVCVELVDERFVSNQLGHLKAVLLCYPHQKSHGIKHVRTEKL